MNYHIIEITIRPNSTIEALIRFYNDLNMKKEELAFLVEEFTKLNPNARPPKPYQKVLMPVLTVYYEKNQLQ